MTSGYGTTLDVLQLVITRLKAGEVANAISILEATVSRLSAPASHYLSDKPGYTQPLTVACGGTIDDLNSRHRVS